MSKESRERIERMFAQNGYVNRKEAQAKRRKATDKELREMDKMIKCGEEYFNNGFLFEEAPEELRNHYFFELGYNQASRRAYAASLTNQNKKGR